jgi:hypothetical protein
MELLLLMLRRRRCSRRLCRQSFLFPCRSQCRCPLLSSLPLVYLALAPGSNCSLAPSLRLFSCMCLLCLLLLLLLLPPPLCVFLLLPHLFISPQGTRTLGSFIS